MASGAGVYSVNLPMFPTCLQGWQDHVMVVKAITHR